MTARLSFNPTGPTKKPRAPRVAAPAPPDDPLWRSDSLTELVEALAAAGAEAVHVGLDVGIGGAVAVTGRRAGVVIGAGVYDLPVTADPNKKGKSTRSMLHLEVFAEMVLTLPLGAIVCLEKYMPIPTVRAQEIHSSDSEASGPGEYHNLRLCAAAAEARGVVAGLARIRRLRRLDEPTPTQWRGKLGLKGGDKEFYRAEALRRYPWLAHMLWAQSHHDRAEALLLADYAAYVS